MDKTAFTELSSVVENGKEKKVPLVENVLNKIREIEERTENDTVNFIDVLDESLEEIWLESNNPLANNYLKLLEDHHKYDGDVEVFKRNSKVIKDKVESLADLVTQRKPNISEEEQLELMDQLYELSSSGDKHRKEDEIQALRIALDTERFKLSSGDPHANPEYTASLEARISDLQGQISF